MEQSGLKKLSPSLMMSLVAWSWYWVMVLLVQLKFAVVMKKVAVVQVDYVHLLAQQVEEVLQEVHYH